MVGLVALYLIGSMAWGVLNMQQCAGLSKKDATCEQIAENNSNHCKYVLQPWKKVDYSKELKACKVWEEQKNSSK